MTLQLQEKLKQMVEMKKLQAEERMLRGRIDNLRRLREIEKELIVKRQQMRDTVIHKVMIEDVESAKKLLEKISSNSID